MARFLKILLWSVVAVVVAVVAIAVALPFVIDPNDYKPRIETLVREQTGRDFTLAGDVSLSVFPWLGIETGQLALANAEPFGDDDMVRVAGARIKVKLLPLLKRQVRIDTIVLDQPVVRLIVDETGRGNWSDLATGGAADAPADKSEPATALAALAIKGVEINDALISWEDRQAGTRFEVDALQIETGEVAGGRPVPVELSFRAKQPAWPDPLQVALSAVAAIDLGAESLTLQDTSATVESADITSRLELPALEADATQIRGQGLALEANMADTQLTAGMDSFAFDQAQQALAMTGLRLDGRYEEQDLQASAEQIALSLAGETLSIPALVARAGPMELRLKVSGTKLLSSPGFTGRFETNRFDAAKLMAQMGMGFESADPAALSRVEAKADFSATASSAKLTGLVLQVDDSTITGSAEVKDLSAPDYGFDLALDAIDVDPYLPPPAETEAAPEAGAAAIAVPLSVLRGVRANGTLRVGEFKSGGLTLSELEFGVRSDDKGMLVKPMDAKLYGGRISGTMRFEDREGGARLDLVETVEGVDVGALLTALAVTEDLEGTGNMEMKLTATESGGKQAMEGTVQFQFLDGALKGVDLQKMVIQAKRIYNEVRGKEKEMDTEVRDRTEFTEMSGTLLLTETRVRNEDLSLKSPLLRVTGKGDALLVENTLDYLLNVNVVGTAEGQGGRELEELKGINIPIKVSGPLDDPKYALDFGALAKGLVKKRVDKEKQDIEQKLEKKLGEKLEKLFR